MRLVRFILARGRTLGGQKSRATWTGTRTCGPAAASAIWVAALAGLAGPGCAGKPWGAGMTGLAGGTKVAAVEPFGTVQPMDGGQTYLRIDEAKADRQGAVMSVNGGAWVRAALVRRGDRVSIAYTRPGGAEGAVAAGTLGYDVWGHTTRDYVRFTEHRWYLDGFGSEARALRVVPYGDLLGPAEPVTDPTSPDRSAAVPLW